MDLLYMFMGALCLAEGIALFTGKDFLMFVGSTKKEDYDLDKVFRVEKWVFTADAAVEAILLAVFGATLFIHVYVFKSRKFRSHE